MTTRIESYQAGDREMLQELADAAGLTLEPSVETRLPQAILWVARASEGGAVLGYLLAWQVADEIELLQLVVAEALRRQGVGGALLDRLIASGRELSARAIHLEVRAGNEAALALYRSRGFAEEARRPLYYADGEDALLLSLWMR